MSQTAMRRGWQKHTNTNINLKIGGIKSRYSVVLNKVKLRVKNKINIQSIYRVSVNNSNPKLYLNQIKLRKTNVKQLWEIMTTILFH